MRNRQCPSSSPDPSSSPAACGTSLIAKPSGGPVPELRSFETSSCRLWMPPRNPTSRSILRLHLAAAAPRPETCALCGPQGETVQPRSLLSWPQRTQRRPAASPAEASNPRCPRTAKSPQRPPQAARRSRVLLSPTSPLETVWKVIRVAWCRRSKLVLPRWRFCPLSPWDGCDRRRSANRQVAAQRREAGVLVVALAALLGVLVVGAADLVWGGAPGGASGAAAAGPGAPALNRVSNLTAGHFPGSTWQP